MSLSLQLILACLSLVAALILIIQHRPLIFPIIAFAVSGLEVLMALHLLRFSVGHLPLDIVFGGILFVSSAVTYVMTSGKTTVAAATVIWLVGTIQILGGLHIH